MRRLSPVEKVVENVDNHLLPGQFIMITVNKAAAPVSPALSS